MPALTTPAPALPDTSSTNSLARHLLAREGVPDGMSDAPAVQTTASPPHASPVALSRTTVTHAPNQLVQDVARCWAGAHDVPLSLLPGREATVNLPPSHLAGLLRQVLACLQGVHERGLDITTSCRKSVYLIEVRVPKAPGGPAAQGHFFQRGRARFLHDTVSPADAAGPVVLPLALRRRVAEGGGFIQTSALDGFQIRLALPLA
ncbi:MAG: hypothetical protein GVY18_03785 [Bacteroidetes bacterium]|jgi:hypothetical protein|nr:hypothetical protein [Bacteroidota bacterium]